ncbi:hypothetical protein FE392_12500 [Xenorhabdus sp. 12]|uniref:Uncharacterized protein n=1 Tax=Xenorhabdus santafensis TaxID=2582833 RepID=A0ABU4SBL9_9GAMM|nr:hypothetical protein [Xenorhabdus sp. 12]
MYFLHLSRDSISKNQFNLRSLMDNVLTCEALRKNEGENEKNRNSCFNNERKNKNYAEKPFKLA